MNATLLPETEATLSVDYKHFIRRFEDFRAEHPQYTFQQAMDAFLADQKIKPAV